MYTEGRLMFFYSESLIHAGAGEGVGAIDLPIQREKATHWPVFWSQGLKGAMREHFEGKGCPADELFVIFGPDSQKEDSQGQKGNPSDNAGAVTFSDARILLFPVWSLKGTYAYVTCPLAIRRLYRDLEVLKACGHDLVDDRIKDAKDIQIHFEGSAHLCEDHCDLLTIPVSEDGGTVRMLALGEMAFRVDSSSDDSRRVKRLAGWLKGRWPEAPWLDLEKRIVVVSDDLFGFLVEHWTEVFPRNAIDDDKGTVKKGALWNEECLNADALMYSTVLAADPRKKDVPSLGSAVEVLNYVVFNPAPLSATPAFLWLGGDQTVGRGILRARFA